METFLPKDAPAPADPRLLPDQHWRHWPLLAGLVALVVYLLTISRGAYPGPSAALMASAAGLIPEHLSDHPCWSLVTHGLAQVAPVALPLQLNVFSALCGAAAVALLGVLVSHLIFCAARENADDVGQLPLPTLEAARVNTGMAEHNRRASFGALLGGWTAALAFAFSVPFWSAASRFQYQTFDLLFLLAVLQFVVRYASTERRSHGLTAALLCGAGCVESAVFIPLSAVLLILLPIFLVRRSLPWERTLWLMLLAAGIGVVLGMLLLVQAQAATLAKPADLWRLGIDLLHAHYQTLVRGLPHTGWVWILLLAFLPAAAALPTARMSFFSRDSLAGVVMHLLFTIATLLCLFNASFSPWGMARESGHLPVVPYLLAAAVAGYLAAYWHLLGALDDSEEDRAIDLSLSFRRWTGACIGWPLLLLVCVFPLVNLREADGRQGAFADAVARDALAHFGGRDWIASSDGLLDCHLLLAAHAQGRELRLLSLAAGTDPLHLRQLQTWIDAEPAFAGQRERLRIAAGFGMLPFLAEWLRVASSAEKKLSIVGTPVIWRLAGWQPVPLGFGYSGTPHAETLRGTDLLKLNRDYWTRMDAMLVPVAGIPPPLDRFRRALRQQVSRAANDLGVLLQDQGQNAEAYEAYRAARLLDAENLSALINLYFLAESGVHAEKKAALANDLSARLGQHPPPLTSIIETYGEIRNTSALAIEGRAWSLRGQPALARSDLDRALALNPGSTNTEMQLAALFLTQGDTNSSERVYRALLAANPSDTRALIGLATVALVGGRTGDARCWLDQARAAGATPDALLLCHASLLLQTGRLDEAIADLHAVTDRQPDNIEAWSLLADALLRRNAFTEIEQRVLPSMTKAVGKSDHVLIHVLRAQLFCQKTPIDFAAARNSYLRALALRPDISSVRNDLLSLDLRSGNIAYMEADASSVIRAEPNDAFANYLLAAALLERNDLPRAEQYFRRSLAIRRTPEALNDFAELLRRQKRFAESEKSVREALAQTPKFYLAWDTLGSILLDAGKPDEAAQAIEQALALCETDARLYLSLARVRLAQGRSVEARKALYEISARFPSVPDSVKTEIAALERKLSASAGAPSGRSLK
jgi:tetratricopeptide (TPR) repeat protein